VNPVRKFFSTCDNINSVVYRQAPRAADRDLDAPPSLALLEPDEFAVVCCPLGVAAKRLAAERSTAQASRAGAVCRRREHEPFNVIVGPQRVGAVSFVKPPPLSHGLTLIRPRSFATETRDVPRPLGRGIRTQAPKALFHTEGLKPVDATSIS
jgi:hypothetical protein